MKRYRTMLFVPGKERRKIDKAIASGADCVILDLEDAVALTEKEAARTVTREALAGRPQRDLFVRVNDMESPFCFRDLMAVVPGRPTGILLPKVESAGHVHCADWLIGQLEREAGMEAGEVRLIALIETAGGLARAAEIARASGRIKCLAFGSMDYSLDVGARLSRDGQELFYARGRVVAASRLAGCEQPVDTVYPDFRDPEGLKRECEAARNFGFQGKLVIHPDQIEVVHAAFAPTPEELAYAHRVIDAFDEAERQGIATVSLDGKMVDYPVMKRARQLLELAST